MALLTDHPGRRVLVAAPQPFYEDRGTPIAVRQIAEALSELRYRVDIVTYPVGRPVDIPGVELHRAANPFGLRHVPVGFSGRKLVLDATFVAALRRRLAAVRYDAIHAVEEAAFPAVHYGRRLGIPVVYDMASSLPEQMVTHPAFRGRAVQALLRWCELWLLRHVDVVVCSTGLADHVRRVAPHARLHQWRFAGLRPAPIPDADAAAARRELGIPAATPVVLYCGTFEPYQGLDDLIGAIPAVRAQVPDAAFVLVGAHGEEGEAVRRRAKAPELAGALLVMARQPRDRVPQLLAMADVLVSTRAYGGNLPLKVFDYLSAGRPIVATDIPAHRSVLADDRAVLVPPGPAPMADALASLLGDPARRARLGDSARAYAAAHLGWRSFVESIDRLYAGVWDRAELARLKTR